MDFSQQKLVFVTGKGGVGKSSIAASIALRESAKGRKVLLVELGDQSFYSSFFKQEVHFKPSYFQAGVDISLFDGQRCLRDYILYFLKIESLYHLFFENKVMSTLINIAPGLSELAIMGKLTSGLRKVGPELHYDLIVVDCYATGHALSLIRAPKGMAESIGVGPMGDQSREIFELITNPQVTSYVIVSLAFEMPTVETIEMYDTLKNEFGIDAKIVCNRLLEEPYSSEELSQLNDQLNNQMKDQHSGKSPIKSFLEYLHQAIEKQNQSLARLKEKTTEVYGVPLLHETQDPLDLIKRMQQFMEKPCIHS